MIKVCKTCAYAQYDEEGENCTCNNYWNEKIGDMVQQDDTCNQWEKAEGVR